MLFNQMLDEIRGYGDVALDCTYFWVPSTYDWLRTNSELINTLASLGVDLKTDQRAKRIKLHASEIIEALKDQRNIYKTGTKPERPFSTNPGE